MSNNKRVLLAILDGWGHGLKRRSDAISLAHTPFIDSLYVKYPSSELVTFGEQVGLPEGQMGNAKSKRPRFSFCPSKFSRVPSKSSSNFLPLNSV